MSDRLLIRVVALHHGAVDRLPVVIRQWIARRVLRRIMADWGYPLTGISHEAVTIALRTLAAATDSRDRAVVAALYAEARDEQARLDRVPR